MRKIHGFLILAVGLILGGCSGGQSSPATDGQAAAPPSTGTVQVVFNDNGTQGQAQQARMLGRFSEAARYRVQPLIADTNIPAASPTWFDRDLGQEEQVLTVNDVPGGLVDVMVDAVNTSGDLVGQAQARNVLVRGGEVTMVGGPEYPLLGIGVSEGIDFPPLPPLEPPSNT